MCHVDFGFLILKVVAFTLQFVETIFGLEVWLDRVVDFINQNGVVFGDRDLV